MGGLLLSLLTACSLTHPLSDKTVYVEPRIGTTNSVTPTGSLFGKGDAEQGQVIPAVLSPHGMNFWTPQTEATEQKSVSPYYYHTLTIQGFRNSHWINGGCTQDYGSVTIMPLSGILKCQPADRASRYAHEQETATPYYYAVRLDDYGILAEMTGTSRAGIFRFSYDKEGTGYLVVQPNSDEGEGYVEYDEAKNEIRGYNPVHRIYQGWGERAGFSGYFTIKLDCPIEAYGTFKGDTIYHGQRSIGQQAGIGLYVAYHVTAQKQIQVRLGSSFTGYQGAEKNLENEIPHFTFDTVKEQLHKEWKKYLDRIEIVDDDETNKRKFYSAMYRSAFLPHVISDCDGQYPAFAKGTPIMQAERGEYYDDYSMWDTYRALHPLLNILSPDRSAAMIRSLLDKYEQGGWLPIFPCWNSYTSEMIGDHCLSLIADAYFKGIRDFDVQKAYRAMRRNAFEQPETYEAYKDGLGRRALDSYLQYGYIPLEDSVREAFHVAEQVSRTLEYAYDDYVLHLMAKELGHEEDADLLQKRAQNYRNVLNPATGYVQGRYRNGEFVKEWNATDFCSFITEGTPCHYTWYVPHDVKGLVQAMGGKEAFSARLDSMFTEHRYWHGNEPCHQVAYLFNYIGEPWKTQQAVRQILEQEYLDAPGGLSGNDDAGQMSAWFVFSSLGFYPVCPGTPYYVIGTPLFEEARLRLPDGKLFVIKAPNVSSDNQYIRRVRWNGTDYTKNYITHEMICSGGVLELEMTDSPCKEWGIHDADCPPSMTE